MNLETEGKDPATDESRLRARNRTALLWISVVCLALAAAGYVFGRWLMAHPPQK